MDTIDEQLDKASAQVTELEAELASAKEQLATLEAANSELRESLAHTKDELNAKETAHRAALEENTTLKAEAKTAEERAAEIYGARASEPAEVAAKGESDSTLKDRFLAADTPEKQTLFLRSLSAEQKAQLYSTT